MPIFWPGLGAFISLREAPKDAWAEAALGAGGPLLGTIAALLCAIPLYFGGNPVFWGTLVEVGVTINLFNLMPTRPLDGGRIIGIVSIWAFPVGLVILATALIRYHLGFVWWVMLGMGLLEFKALWKRNKEGYFQVTWTRKLAMTTTYVSLGVLLLFIAVTGRDFLQFLSVPEQLTLAGGILLGTWGTTAKRSRPCSAATPSKP
jgi:Zn-dependent protease